MRLKFSYLSDMMEMVMTLLTDLIDMCGHTEIKIKPRSLIPHSSGRMISVLSEFN